MNTTTVSIAEGKKGFRRLIQDTLDKKENIIVTRRGKPVAVIVPYDEYNRTLRLEGYRKIMEARDIFHNSGINADAVYQESRKELEERR